MTRFEDNLWREVESRYGSELSGADGPLQRRSRLRMPMIAGTSLGLVGAGTAAVIVLTAASSSPAYAVTSNPDGTVSVVIHRIEGIPGANQRLAQLGIRARTVRVAGACQATTPPGLARVTVATFVRNRDAVSVGSTDGRVTARIRPTQIPTGRTLIIPAVPNGARVRLVRGRAVSGAAPACLAPTVLIRPAPGRSGGRIVTCRAATVLHPRPVAPSQGTNPTSTNAPAPSMNTETTTGTGTTNTGTTPASTNTNDSGATTTGVAASASPPAGPPSITLMPSLARACLLVAQSEVR
jgi:hypothetical protein